MRGRAALIGFLIVEAGVLLVWIVSLSRLEGIGPVISSDAQIWSGAVVSTTTGSFRGGSAVTATGIKVFELLLWASLFIIASAAGAIASSRTFRSGRTWTSAGLAAAALACGAGGVYFIVQQWSGDTMFPPGSVNVNLLYAATRAFLIQFFIGWILLAAFVVLAIAGVATPQRPLGFRFAVLNWVIVAIVWASLYLGFYVAPGLFAGA